MTLLRLSVLAASILAGFVPATVALAQAPVEWYTDTGGGGVLAQPPQQSNDGGAEAPRTATGPVDVAESDISASEPVASASQAEPVLGAPSDEPVPAAERRPTSRASQDAPTVTGGEDQEGSDAGVIASLPLTGLQLAAVGGAGLCLLLAGAALRPRRRPAASR
jgi:hypothetical protein